MNSSREELERVLELLAMELEEDRKQYQYKLQTMSFDLKKEEGFLWYPLSIKDTYYGVGQRLIVEFEKSYESDAPNHFQSGKVVKLFSNSEYHEGGEINGVISGLKQNSVKVVFFADELPEWSYKGKIGLELQFDETSYREMNSALHLVMKAKNNRLAELREILLGYRKPNFSKAVDLSLESLNESQNKAIRNILSAEDVAIIHGPPGTGKTTTLVASIVEVLKEEDQVLVCAASNTAVDLLTERIAAKGIDVLRIGNPARVSEDQIKFTLDYKISSHKEYKRIKELRKSANDLRNIAGRYKRNFGKSEREQRKMVYREARKMAEEAGLIENYITDDLVSKAQVIAATLVGANNHVLERNYFSTVFMDEAGQALEPASWIPIMKADRVILAGDHMQLPPTVKSFDAAKAGLSETLFEKCIKRQEVDVMLSVQYRMNKLIMEFSNQEFYSGGLVAANHVENHTLAARQDSPLFNPISFIDTAGCSFLEKAGERTRSLFNVEEANLLFHYLLELSRELKRLELSKEKFTCGIISPYKAQVEYLMNNLPNEYTEEDSIIKVNVNTIDGFQGQERDIILLSLVRSNELGEIGFLSDTRRMNVGLTRARKKLAIFGDSSTIGQHPFYKNFLNYIDKTNSYHSAWEYISL